MARPSAGIWDSVQKTEVLRAVMRHKALAAGIVVMGMTITAIYTATSPVLYRSTASVLIENYSRMSTAYPEDTITYAQDVTKAQRILAQSRPVILRTVELGGESLGLSPDTAMPAGFETRVDGQLLYFDVVDRDPDRARRLANTWSSAFVKEMGLRAQAPRKILDESLENFRKDLMAKQERLNKFKRENNFDAKEFEQSPVRKRFEDLSIKLNAANMELASLESELQVLQTAANEPTALLQLPRAKADPTLLGLQRQIELCRARLADARRDYRPGSVEVQGAEQSLNDALAEHREAAKALAREVQLARDMVKGEHDRLAVLFQQAAREYDDLKAKGAQYDILNNDALLAREIYTEWGKRKGETDITSQFTYSSARPWETAEAAVTPYKPNWRRNMLTGLVVSLVAAVAFAFLMERLDDTVRSGKDLERRLGAAPLGVIPIFERTLADEDGYLLAQRQASSAVVDSLRSIHIGLEVTHGAHRTGQPVVITVTSAVPHEGKSFLASNLATLFAGLGRKVLVVDADLRKGSLTRAFKCESNVGLREAIAAGKWSPEYALNTTTPGYALLPVTEVSYSNPESLNPEGLARVLPMMKSGYDVVIFDTPPVLAVADACVTGQSSDVVLMVVRSRQTRLAQVERAAATLYAASVKQVLFVVNGVDAADAASDAYGYGYGYDYGDGYGYGSGYGYGHGYGYGYGYGRGRRRHRPGKRAAHAAGDVRGGKDAEDAEDAEDTEDTDEERE